MTSNPPRSINFPDESQVQSKYTRHALDFGITEPYSPQNAELFKDILGKHVLDETVTQIMGTYRGQAVIHYLNENTLQNVFTDMEGNFISCWKLSSEQSDSVKSTGRLW